MKKIAICSLLACMCVSVAGAATYDCNVQQMSSLSFKVSNEFLFPTYGDYNDKNGWAFVCGHRKTNGCDSGAMVLISGEHYLGNIRYEDGLYRCSTNGGNAWAQSDKNILPKCTDEQIKTFKLFDDTSIGKRRIYCRDAVGTYKAGGRCVGRSAGDICWTDYCPDCEKIVENQCTFSDGSKHNLGESVEYDCSQSPDTPEFRQNARTGVKCYQTCLKRNAGGALTNYWSVKTCPKGKDYVAFDSSDYQKYTPNIPGYKRCDNANDVPENKSCKESRSTVKGKACCDIPSNEAKYDAKTDMCNCLNDKEFEIDANGRGQCVAKEQKQQNEEPCYYNYTGYIRCPNGNFSLTMKQYKLEKSDLEGKSCDEFKRLYENDVNASEALRAKICAEKQSAVVVTVPVGPSETQIKDARDTLKTFAANAESNASGWKTAEGKFNTTRLASDLTAGVVLGTVGGVVSGVVIKKKQVEKGFDALHCTVGGHKVADWGDTFTVGLLGLQR